MTVSHRILPGLPPYGRRAVCFPRPDAFSEGLVVEIRVADHEPWVGNFALGLGGVNIVLDDLGPRYLIVVAEGAGYVVDAETRTLQRTMGDCLRRIEFVEELGAMVASNDCWFEAFDADHLLWRSPRISWDGLRNVQRQGLTMTGEAYSPIDDDWYSFELDIRTGDARGGSYNGPSM